MLNYGLNRGKKKKKQKKKKKKASEREKYFRRVCLIDNIAIFVTRESNARSNENRSIACVIKRF